MNYLPVVVLAAVGGAYLILCAVTYRFLFVPRAASRLDDFGFTPWEFGADYEEFDLVTGDGVAFGGWFLRQPSSTQTIVISGGHKGRRQDTLGIAIALWRKGFNVFTYSYRGMKGSDRSVVTLGLNEVNELQATIALARRRVKDARIGLLGFSMGAVVSLLGAAGEPSVEALVLDSPFSDLRQLVNENFRRATLLPGGLVVAGVSLLLRLRTGCRISECSPLGVLGALEPRPLFFIHGGADETTSVNHSRRLHDAYRGPREIWILQGAPHGGAYVADRELYLERVAGFFVRTLGMNRTGQLRLVEDEAG